MPTANAKNNAAPAPYKDRRARIRATGKKQPEVSHSKPRGYLKIAHAAQEFGIDFRDRTVLDIGSSTGGFTQYALDRGAARVVAVEKGTHQMSAPLRFDPRVELHEKTDIFDFCPTTPPDIITIDISFLSLTKVLKYASMNLTGSHTQLLAMLKPQFEARPHQMKNGIIKNSAIRRDIIKTFEQWLKNNHFTIIAKRDNATTGRHGNLERFYHLAPAKSHDKITK